MLCFTYGYSETFWKICTWEGFLKKNLLVTLNTLRKQEAKMQREMFVVSEEYP